MAHLAKQNSQRICAGEIADVLDLPLPALTNILKELTRCGLVTAVRGPGGGYRLARDPELITLGQMLEAIGGPIRLTKCCAPPTGDDSPSCRREHKCEVKGVFQTLHRGIRGFLSGVTLARLVSEGGSPAGAERSPIGLW